MILRHTFQAVFGNTEVMIGIAAYVVVTAIIIAAIEARQVMKE